VSTTAIVVIVVVGVILLALVAGLAIRARGARRRTM